MAGFVPKDATFSLFKNDDKLSDTSPDYSGRIIWINGTVRKLIAWEKEIKKGKNKGKTFLSGMIVEYKPSNPSKKPEDQPRQQDFDDDIPF